MIEPRVDNRGYVTDKALEQQLVVGVSRKEDVQALLGSPSTTSTFGGDSWYYITATKESLAFLKPEVTQQDVTRVEFDAQGYFATIEHYDQADAEAIQTVDKRTPTAGQGLGFFEQVLGNLGRFARPAGSSGASRSPGRP